MERKVFSRDPKTWYGYMHRLDTVFFSNQNTDQTETKIIFTDLDTESKRTAALAKIFSSSHE